MFIKNTSKKDVQLRSHEGYAFVVPSGVSAIWQSAGEALMKVYAVNVPITKTDKYGLDNGNGLPALREATKAEWEKGGKILAGVKRFKINAKLIPRAALIKTALQRGIEGKRISEYQIDSTIDPETIAEEINALPVPDEIKYPVNIEEDGDEDS